MKKITKLMLVVLAVALVACMFTACKQPDNPNPDQPSDDGKLTVCWYEGSKLLREDKVDKGAKLESWTPTSDAGEFDGWYAEASKTEAFDFTKGIEADTDIFAKFRSNEFAEDPNSYYLCGSGAGDMQQAAWDHGKAEAALTMKKSDAKDANVYTIQIKMYAGDMFQICYGGGWDGQQGIGFVKGVEYCDGVNFYDNNTYTAADKKVAQVKNDAGEVVFIGSDEYNSGYEKWNIKLAEGMDGVYEFTFTTYPNAKEYNQLTFKLVEKLDAMTSTHDMRFIGTHNEWGTTYEGDTWGLKASDDKSTWTGILVVTPEMYADWTEGDAGNPHGVKCAAVKLYNTVNGGYFSPDGNNIFLTEGTYAFKYTVEGDKVEYAKCEYYVVGTILDADGNPVNFAVKEGATPKLTVDGTTASVKINVKNVSTNSAFNWLSDGKICAVKVVLGSELGIDKWYGDKANGDDNFYFTAEGEYTVTFDIASETVTIQ